MQCIRYIGAMYIILEIIDEIIRVMIIIIIMLYSDRIRSASVLGRVPSIIIILLYSTHALSCGERFHNEKS